MAYKGKYRVKNPGKYKGDHNKVIYRSGLELKVMNYLDLHSDVLEWSSEEVIIPYRSPMDGKMHRYFVDFYVKKRNRAGTIDTVLIEVKPKSQTMPPRPRQRKTRRYLKEVATWGINSAKWEAAESYCAKRG